MRGPRLGYPPRRGASRRRGHGNIDDDWNAFFALVRGSGGKIHLVLSLGNGLSDKDDGTHLREVDSRLVSGR